MTLHFCLMKQIILMILLGTALLMEIIYTINSDIITIYIIAYSCIIIFHNTA